MTNLRFKVFSPGGNLTALIYESVLQSRRMRVVKAILSHYPDIEQVGFVKANGLKVKLDMMGGEFSVNTACCCIFDALSDGEKELKITVSGFAQEVSGWRKADTVTIVLPKDFLVGTRQVAEGLLVDLRGIRFLVTPSPALGAGIEQLMDKYGGGSPAMGVVHIESNAEGFGITPWVKVIAVDSLVKEMACGSGSIAAAYFLRHLHAQNSFNILQPSGSSCRVELNHAIHLSGPVIYLGERAVLA